MLANRPEIEGIRARTLRLLIMAAKRIDQEFRDNPAHQALFMAIIRSPYRLYDTLVDMKRYGILGNYIPAFGQIMGLMQYDLFHIYTVDAHTLLLIRNLNRFKETEFAQHFPVVSSVFQRLARRDIVYLAAIFTISQRAAAVIIVNWVQKMRSNFAERMVSPNVNANWSHG